MPHPTRSPRTLTEGYSLTRHARQRMRSRGIPPDALRAVLWYGRLVHTRGADVYAIGRQEVRRYAAEGLHLAPYEGLQVVCTPEGHVLTAYRNRDFRSLRSHRPHWHGRPSR